MFSKKSVLRNIVKFIECWGLYFDEVADVHPAVFRRILLNFSKHFFLEQLRTTTSFSGYAALLAPEIVARK